MASFLSKPSAIRCLFLYICLAVSGYAADAVISSDADDAGAPQDPTPLQLLLAAIPELRDMLKPESDSDIIRGLDRMIELAPKLSEMSTEGDFHSHITEWFAFAERISKRTEQTALEVSVMMICYGSMFEYTESEMGLILHHLLQFGLQSEIGPVMQALLDALPPAAVAVRNESDETPLIVAFRHTADQADIQLKLVELSSDADLLYALPVVLGMEHVPDARWSRMFNGVIHRRLEVLDYDLNGFFQEIGIGDNRELCSRAEYAIRVRDTYFRNETCFMLVYMHIFAPGKWTFMDTALNIVPDEEVAEYLCDLHSLEGGHRTFFCDSWSFLESKNLSPEDVLRRCDFAADIPLDPLFAVTTSLIVNTDLEEEVLALLTEAQCEILDIAFRHWDVPIGQMLRNEFALWCGSFLLAKLAPELKGPDSEVISQLANLAMKVGPGLLQTNLFRVAIFIGNAQQDVSILQEFWKTFTRADVLALQSVWFELFGDLKAVLEDPNSGTIFTDATLRILSVMRDHPDIVIAANSMGTYPPTYAHHFLSFLLDQHYMEALMALYSRDDSGDFSLKRYLPSNEDIVRVADTNGEFADWVRASSLKPKKKEDCSSDGFICCICYSGPQAEEATDEEDLVRISLPVCEADGVAPTEDDFVSVPCGHVFHHQCIMKWLHWNRTCPDCRTSVYDLDAVAKFVSECLP